MYMGNSIRPHEELRAGMLDDDRDCSICGAGVQTECETCGDAICFECAVQCSSCRGATYCLRCAIKRGLVEIDDEYYCEDCASELEPDLEAVRR